MAFGKLLQQYPYKDEPINEEQCDGESIERRLGSPYKTRSAPCANAEDFGGSWHIVNGDFIPHATNVSFVVSILSTVAMLTPAPNKDSAVF